MGKKSGNLIDTSKYDQPAKVAKECAILKTTLYAAIKRGEVETYTLACGTIVVSIADVKQWIEAGKTGKRRGPGKPRKGE